MTEIVLLRHGKCKFNAWGKVNGLYDSELHRQGEKQARTLAQRLASPAVKALVPWPSKNAIFSSRLQRASRTGEIVTTHLGLPAPQPSELLVERDLGQATGLTFAQAGALIDDADKIRTAYGVTYVESSKYGFETFDEATEKGRRFVDFSMNIGEDAVVWAFTHGDRAMSIIAAWTGRPMRELIHEVYVPNTGVVVLDGTHDYRLLNLAA